MRSLPSASPGGFHGIPGALRLADAFQRFGDRRLDTVKAVRTMSPAGQWLSVDPRIAWYPTLDPNVTRHLTARAQADGVAVTRMGLGCGIILERTAGVGDGLAQAACMLMPIVERQAQWSRLAAIGADILLAARQAARATGTAEAFPDLITLRRLSERASEDAVRDGLVIPNARATQTLGAERGVEGTANLNAAILAAYQAGLDPDAGSLAFILSRTVEREHLIRCALATSEGTATERGEPLTLARSA